jgi:hypothetical protein
MRAWFTEPTLLHTEQLALPFLALEKTLTLTGEVEVELEVESLEEERKMPLKLRRRDDLGGESCWDEG